MQTRWPPPSPHLQTSDHSSFLLSASPRNHKEGPDPRQRRRGLRPALLAALLGPSPLLPHRALFLERTPRAFSQSFARAVPAFPRPANSSRPRRPQTLSLLLPTLLGARCLQPLEAPGRDTWTARAESPQEHRNLPRLFLAVSPQTDDACSPLNVYFLLYPKRHLSPDKSSHPPLNVYQFPKQICRYL